MTESNVPSLPEFARQASEMCRDPRGFEATQTIDAGPIHIEARVATRPPDRLAVEYSAYTNPLLEFEEAFTGDVDYTPDEIVGLSLHFDGQKTWIHDTSTGVCIVKPTRFLIEPLPEFDLMGSIDFLRDLPHDYLIREKDPETIEGRETRVLGLKPKRLRRSSAFRLTAFLARHATVAFDPESLFPVRYRFVPAASTQIAPLLGEGGRVAVQFSSLRWADDAAAPFEPPEGTRIFREELQPLDELSERLPFPITLASLREAGFESPDGLALLAENEEHDRVYGLIALARDRDVADGRPAAVTLRFGNYLSRNMARRKLTLAESGEDIGLGDDAGRFLDRSSLWGDSIPEVDRARAPRELSWERDGVFWFLTGIGVEREELAQLATNLLQAPGA